MPWISEEDNGLALLLDETHSDAETGRFKGTPPSIKGRQLPWWKPWKKNRWTP